MVNSEAINPNTCKMLAHLNYVVLCSWIFQIEFRKFHIIAKMQAIRRLAILKIEPVPVLACYWIIDRILKERMLNMTMIRYKVSYNSKFPLMCGINQIGQVCPSAKMGIYLFIVGDMISMIGIILKKRR